MAYRTSTASKICVQRTKALHIYDSKLMSKYLNTTYSSCPDGHELQERMWLLQAGTLEANVRHTTSRFNREY
jgi:hypothetical protein